MLGSRGTREARWRRWLPAGRILPVRGERREFQAGRKTSVKAKRWGKTGLVQDAAGGAAWPCCSEGEMKMGKRHPCLACQAEGVGLNSRDSEHIVAILFVYLNESSNS